MNGGHCFHDSLIILTTTFETCMYAAFKKNFWKEINILVRGNSALAGKSPKQS